MEGVNELEVSNIPLLEKGINILDASCGRANSPPQLRRGGRDIKKYRGASLSGADRVVLVNK